MHKQEDRNTRRSFPILSQSSVYVAFLSFFYRFSLRPLFLHIIIISLLSASLPAQPNSDDSLELRLTSLEQEFDRQVFNILSNYFERSKFFVDVNVDAQVVDEIYRTTQNQTIEGPAQNVIMPGLPYLPDENIQPSQREGSEQTQRVVNESTVQRLRVNQLEVNIYADTSFSPQQVEFMRLLGGIASKVNEERGDIVNVFQVSMPEIDMGPQPQILEVKQPFQDPLTAAVRDYIPGLMLMLLLGLALIIGKYSNNQSMQSALNMRRQRDQFKNDQTYEAAPVDKEDSQSRPGEDAEEQQSEIKRSDLDFITRQFLLNSKEVALLFEFWVANHAQKGMEDAARVILTIDKHMVKALKKDLLPDIYKRLSEKVYAMDELAYQEKKEVASNFIKALEEDLTTEQTSRRHYQLDLFQFLNHVEEHQIEQLLVGEDKQSAALVVDYLPDEISARMLKRFDKKRTADIMVGSSELNTLSYQDHKKISSRLFSKMMDILETEKELNRGMDNVLKILNQLPLEEQQKYIKQLKTTGSQVGEYLDKQFITINDIPNINPGLLKQALDSISTETLLEAFAGMNEHIIDHILSVRPKREQRLLKLELKQSEPANEADAEKAKQAVMNAIRNAVSKAKEF